MPWLLVLFVGLPILELTLLIQLGKVIGVLPTVLLIIVTGTLGASLARWQGLGVLARIRSDLDRGSMPAGALLDGVLILIAGAVLLTPGVLTDLFGFLCLIPQVRQGIKSLLLRWIEKRFKFVGPTQVQPMRRADSKVIDIELE